MKRWVVTVIIAGIAVVIACVALWLAIAAQTRGDNRAQPANPDGGTAANPADAAPAPVAAKPACTGRYADSFEQISERNREYERSPSANYSYCIRNTAGYEQVYYDAEGKLVKRHLKSVIHGTAFVFKEHGGEWFLLTNDHVASQPEVTDESSKLEGIPFGAKKVSETIKIVKNEDDDFEKNHITLTKVANDPQLDAAILKTPARLNASPYKIGLSAELRVGNAVMVKGFPLGIFDVSSSGKVTNVRVDDADGDWSHADFVIDAQLNTGQSGSPVMAINCQTGELEIVGLFHAYYSAAKGLNLAVHIDELNDLIAAMKAKKRDRRGPSGFLPADDQLKVVKYLLDRKNLNVFRYGGSIAGAEVEKDRTVRIHLYSDAFPSNPLPRITFVDTFRRTYGEIDQIIFVRRSGRQVVKTPAAIPEEIRRHFTKIYADLWQQLLKTIAYRDLLAYSQESEDLYKRTVIRYNEIEGARKAQAEQVEAVLFDADKILSQEEQK